MASLQISLDISPFIAPPCTFSGLKRFKSSLTEPQACSLSLSTLQCASGGKEEKEHTDLEFHILLPSIQHACMALKGLKNMGACSAG